MFNGMAKVPLQFFILFTGAMVFVFYLFEPAPIFFEKPVLEKARSVSGFTAAEQNYSNAFETRKQAAFDLAAHPDNRDSLSRFRSAQKDFVSAQQKGTQLAEQTLGTKYNNTNYVFLSFVTKYLPAGLVGLIIAVIFAAAMSSSAGEINSLATVTVMDLYRRYLKPAGADGHYLMVSRVATAFWGLYAMVFAHFSQNLGSLVEAVNLVGSLFYGSLLGVFTLAFFFKRVSGTGAFWGMILGEVAIFSAFFFTNISFLWYNVIGAIVVVVTGLLFQFTGRARVVPA
jgi:Na+(H+)/acetate symporter ActP